MYPSDDVQKEIQDLWELLFLLRAQVGPGSITSAAWTPDVLPIASPFTPTPSQLFVAVNTAGGVVTVRTPLSPTGGRPFDGQVFFIKSRVASANPITVNANAATPGGCTVEDPSNGGTFGANGAIQSVAGACIGFKFRASDGLWIAFSGM